MAPYLFEDHTAEVRVRITAPALSGVFEEAGRAIAELMLEATAGELGPEQTVTLGAPDPGALLVDWINELVYLSETTGQVFTVFCVDHVTERAIEARVRGVVPDAIRTAVKAATLHDVSVQRTRAGYEASVVLDV